MIMTHMEDLKFLRMLPLLSLDEPKLEVMVIGNASTSVTTSESEVRNQAINLDDDDEGCI